VIWWFQGKQTYGNWGICQSSINCRILYQIHGVKLFWEAVTQLVKKFPSFYDTWRFITVHTTAQHRILYQYEITSKAAIIGLLLPQLPYSNAVHQGSYLRQGSVFQVHFVMMPTSIRCESRSTTGKSDTKQLWHILKFLCPQSTVSTCICPNQWLLGFHYHYHYTHTQFIQLYIFGAVVLLL